MISNLLIYAFASKTHEERLCPLNLQLGSSDPKASPLLHDYFHKVNFKKFTKRQFESHVRYGHVICRTFI